MDIIIPRKSLVVLCGPAGSGKTTFARQHFLPTQIISSDFCRKLITDKVDWSPHVSPSAFRVLFSLMEERLRLGKLTVIDSTAINERSRTQYVSMARRFSIHPVLIVMNIPDSICIERDSRRSQPVGKTAITSQWERLQNSLENIQNEGFDYFYIFNEKTQFNSKITIGVNPNKNKSLQTVPVAK